MYIYELEITLKVRGTQKMKKWFEKLSKTAKIGMIAGAVAIVAVVAVVLILVLGNKEEAYRNIRVNEVTGEVYVNRDGLDGLKVSANMNLQSGDEIITEKGARLTLRLDDDKYIIMDEASKMKLIATGTAEDSKTRLELEYGGVFSDIKNKLSAKSSYNVVTPTSTMSVRGTQLEVVYRMVYDEAGEVQGAEIKTVTYEGVVLVEVEGMEETQTLEVGDVVEQQSKKKKNVSK